MSAKKKPTTRKRPARRGGGGANMVGPNMPYYAHLGGGGARSRGPTRLEDLESSLPKGWIVRTYSPGDGVTRYRFFHNPPQGQSYFGPASGAYTALGYKEAVAFVSGLQH